MEIVKTIGEIISSDITRNIIMVITASTAFIIYLLNKRDSFRRASNIVLLEIKEVESVIANVRVGQFLNTNIPIMKSNSWKEYKHYFVNKLDIDEYQQLNNFYIQSEIIENERAKIANSFTISIEEKSKLMQKLLLDLAKENSSDPQKYEQKKNECTNIVHNESYFFEPKAPKDKLNQALAGMQIISTTNIGNKLKKFAR